MRISRFRAAPVVALIAMLAAVLLLVWSESPARAADISAHTNMWGVTLIDIDGFIEPGDEQKFAKLSYPSAVVRLSGRGGFIGPALDIAGMIWKRGYTTLVWRGGGPCGSACAIIWLHGRKSAVQRNSYLC